MLSSMKHPVYVRPLEDAERTRVVAGLRSSDAFVHRRAQILLASARGEQAPRIARHLGCDAQTVRNAIAAFNARGLAALSKGSPPSGSAGRPFARPCSAWASAGNAPSAGSPVPTRRTRGKKCPRSPDPPGGPPPDLGP